MLKSATPRTLAATTVAMGILLGQANAAVSAITSGTGAGGDIRISLPPIDFIATSPFGGGTLIMVFDEAQPSPGGMIGSLGEGSSQFSGPALGGGGIKFYFESGYVGFGNVITQNDPYVGTETAAPFRVGDTVSFAGGTIFMTAPKINLDVFASGSYEVFLTTNFADRLSTNGVAIPEPTSVVLLGLGALGMAAIRRRIR